MDQINVPVASQIGTFSRLCLPLSIYFKALYSLVVDWPVPLTRLSTRAIMWTIGVYENLSGSTTVYSKYIVVVVFAFANCSVSRVHVRRKYFLSSAACRLPHARLQSYFIWSRIRCGKVHKMWAGMS